jgi:SAM-dependent methyltransferase
MDDLAGFKAGRPQLLPFEVEEIGPLDGPVLHLQCQSGLDSLDIARLHPTAQVTGLDPSPSAIGLAVRLAEEMKLQDRARFVVGPIYRSVDLLEHQTFDVVYTGKGAMLRLPDIDQWAEMVRDLLVGGGFLYLSEYHPVAEVLATDQPVPTLDYFSFEDSARSLWLQPISRVLTALVRAGLRLQLFHEWDYTSNPTYGWLTQGPDRYWRWPGPGTLPLMYSLKAVRPGPGNRLR